MRSWLTGLTVLALVACTSTRKVSRPLTQAQADEISAAAADGEVALRIASPGLQAPREVQGTRLVLDREKATWQDPSGERRTVPIAALQEIRHSAPGSKRPMGALHGLLFGLGAGVITGGAIGLASGDDQCPPSLDWCFFRFSAREKAVLGAVGLGAMGALTGAVIGSLVGARTAVEFE